MATLRWLHLSDFHTGKDRYGQVRLFKNILEFVEQRVAAGQKPDAIFLTGDVGDRGQLAQYEEFNNSFLLPLLDLLPPSCQDRIYLIPGNHDVDRSQTRAVQTYDILVKVPEFLDPGEVGLFERDQAVFPRFQAYAESDLTISGNHWLFSPEGVRVDTFTHGGARIGVLGINTAWLSCSDYDRHRLSPGRPLLEEGLEKLAGCDVKFVLGHHPLDWFLDEELEPIRTLLGRHNAIYLHGHMHKARSKFEEGAGYPFLALQSGACFQAREDELWVNRFLWCELDLQGRRIAIEPFQWSRDHQEWALDALAFPEKYRDGDLWAIPLPDPTPVVEQARPKSASVEYLGLPKGWIKVDSRYLKGLAKDLTADQALRFFDGRTPIWREALAPQIPRREIVKQVVGEIEAARAAGKLHVTLLSGAAGEGKTTALMQAVCDLVAGHPNWNILWHDDPISPLPANFIAQLPSDETWIIVSDDAEIIARRVFEITQLIAERRNVQFLLCCRDTDWKAAGADGFNWKQHGVNFVQINLRGLSHEDAEQVVLAWSKYGQDGLKSLKDHKLEAARQLLLETARSEAANPAEGTFFGAILHVRLGDGLKDHIRTLLEKLEGQPIGGGKTLRDAFHYIAAMHAENLLFLSKEVLASVLMVPYADLKRKVLFPLGEEAAIATTGRFVFTRHFSIAEVVLQILEESDLDIENLYVDMLEAAVSSYLVGTFIPSLGDWNGLPYHFFNKGDHAFGIRLARAGLELEPHNPFSIVRLAHLFREAGQAEQGANLFRSMKSRIQRSDRAFYFEWGTCEGNVGNQALSICLDAFSLSDECVRRPPDYKDARSNLAGMSLGFAQLFDQFHDRAFNQACGVTAQLGLGLMLLDDRTRYLLRQNLKRAEDAGFKKVPVEVAYNEFKEGIQLAWDQRESELPPWVLPAGELNFEGLFRLLRV